MKSKIIKNWKQKLESELKENILSFWIRQTQDLENGGFYGYISNDNTIKKDAPKGLIPNARILWTFSAAARYWNKDKYIKMANRAYDYILKYFFDNKYGGGYWMLDFQGNPIDKKKKSYGQAFLIYGLSEYYRATGSEEALNLAKDYFDLIENKIYDQEIGGYIETFNRDWSISEDARLSEKDMDEKISMNNHLHILEAYTNLLRVWKNALLEERLSQLIRIFLEHIISSDNFHLNLFFDENWNVKSETISYGHDIECSWLLLEAAQVLGDAEVIDEVEAVVPKMVDVTIQEGINDNGAVYYEKKGTGEIVRDIDWWPQAETVVGLVNAYQITGQTEYLEQGVKTWQFIEENVVNKEYGEWYNKITPDGESCSDCGKVSIWKGPYHNARACMELIDRLEKIIE